MSTAVLLLGRVRSCACFLAARAASIIVGVGSANLTVVEERDVRSAAGEEHRLRRAGDNTLDAAAGAVPQQQQVARAGIEDVDAAGQQGVGLGAAAAEGDPFGGDVGQAK